VTSTRDDQKSAKEVLRARVVAVDEAVAR